MARMCLLSGCSEGDEQSYLHIPYGPFRFKGIEDEEQLHGIYPLSLRDLGLSIEPPVRQAAQEKAAPVGRSFARRASVA